MGTQTRTINAGPVGIKPRGAYSSTDTYTLLDCVLYNHDSWVCIAMNQDGSAATVTGQAPADGSQYWKALTDGGRAAVAVGTQVRTDFDTWFGATANAGIRKTVSDWLTSVQTAWTEWFSDTLPNGVRKIWNTWFGQTQTEWTGLRETVVADHTTAVSDHTIATNDHTTAATDHTVASTDHGTAGTDHTQATSDHTRAETDHQTASDDHGVAAADHTQAGTDHTASVAATSEASNVNAQLEGMTVTITNRSGVATSVNIGFEIYRTYTSVAAMQADAANVPQAKFVMIATIDATDPDNAKLYAKNAAGGFTFLSDLDQASSAAFADWLENYKPVIESDHTQAGLDHQQAVSDHSTAASDHTQAGTDHTRAESDHSTSQTASGYANTQGDYAKNMADHPAYLADGTAAHPGDAGYLYTWDYTTQQYVKGARLSIDFDSMTPEQREELAQAVLAAIGFDTVPTENSEKAVTSGGLYIAFQNVNTALGNVNDAIDGINDDIDDINTALEGKQDTLSFATVAESQAAARELT